MATSGPRVTGGGHGFPTKRELVPGNNAGFCGKFRPASKQSPDRFLDGREGSIAPISISGASPAPATKANLTHFTSETGRPRQRLNYAARKRGRAVECSSLENCRGCKSSVSSNLTASATSATHQPDRFAADMTPANSRPYTHPIGRTQPPIWQQKPCAYMCADCPAVSW
jgi:hypothetical protein